MAHYFALHIYMGEEARPGEGSSPPAGHHGCNGMGLLQPAWKSSSNSWFRPDVQIVYFLIGTKVEIKTAGSFFLLVETLGLIY